MRALPSSLRKQLETSVLAARRAAETAARAAIESLGVFADRRPEYLDSAQAALRNGLRAKWRQLSNDRDLLVTECAYEQWHRLLFARFLAENGLLLHPQFRAPVTLAECEELAADLGEPDAWSVAVRFAAEILPGIFRLDDPCVRLRSAPEGRQALEQILDAIPADTFAADDALGWVYQFWQKDKKDEVNASERKIGGADLGPVTQLFTENYMVRFLLENSLGAWWAARHPDSRLVKGFDYLRFDDGGEPIVGAFGSWPDRVAEVTVMDPCCGSGHFLIEAFSMLWQMRTEEEGLAPVEAQDAVLRDNLFGLELDPRCVQIAMFNVALQAWKAGGEWRQLPVPNIACSGIPVKAPVEEWKALARGDERLEKALVRLHILFREADTLGSLIDPRRATEITRAIGLQASFEDVPWEEVIPILDTVLDKEVADPASDVLGADAAGIARAADYLSRRYTLVVTNVPYLGIGGQGAVLRDMGKEFFSVSKADLATMFLERWLLRKHVARTASTVSNQTWLYLQSYRKFREKVLESSTGKVFVRLGAGAFEAITGEVVQVTLSIVENEPPTAEAYSLLLDLSDVRGVRTKHDGLLNSTFERVSQRAMLQSPYAVIAPAAPNQALLSDFVDVHYGSKPGQTSRVKRFFWELPRIVDPWVKLESRPEGVALYSGKSEIILRPEAAWAAGVQEFGIRGSDAWGSDGVIMSKMTSLPSSIYCGEIFDDNTYVLVPWLPADLGPVLSFVRSPQYAKEVRRRNQKLAIDTAAMVNVPIDIDRWRQAAAAMYPKGLPEPWSDDPTQWLSEGQPHVSTAPLQVAVARLCGYRWPEQPEFDDLDVLADADGIVCLAAVAGEPPAADRVQQLLAAAFGESWTSAKVKELLEQTGSKKKNLADWLRDEFFKQHCSLFGNRPFVWHIWDGQRDGFSALVNCHRLDRRTLEKLTYTYLGQDWVERQRAEVRDGVAGAEARLTAALGLQRRLEAILEGEAPLDIYVRWKEIHEQPVGWEPDLDDGVRLNIRPFVEAGVLRSPFNIHWRKDRGKNPDGTERLNDVHLTLAEKVEAPKRVGPA
jgi:hypothetical protein